MLRSVPVVKHVWTSVRLPPSPWKMARQKSTLISALIAKLASTSAHQKQFPWNKETNSFNTTYTTDIFVYD